MKLANLEKILGIFAPKDEDLIGEKLRETDDLHKFNKGIRGVINYKYLNEIANNTRPDVYPRIQKAVKKNYFNKMFEYIQDSDYKNTFVIHSTVEDLGKEKVIKCINQLMDHFIELEEYEKCTILRDVIQVINYQC